MGQSNRNFLVEEMQRFHESVQAFSNRSYRSAWNVVGALATMTLGLLIFVSGGILALSEALQVSLWKIAMPVGTVLFIVGVQVIKNPR